MIFVGHLNNITDKLRYGSLKAKLDGRTFSSNNQTLHVPIKKEEERDTPFFVEKKLNPSSI